MNLVYLYLIAPLHTGGTTQEGNLLGIARESHTDLPYVPSSSIRGRLRASVGDESLKFQLFGNEIAEGQTLEQGSIWIGDGSILWIPVPSLSHGVVWVSCPMLLRRWLRLTGNPDRLTVPEPYETSIGTTSPVYLKDAILPATSLIKWADWDKFTTEHPESTGLKHVLVLPDRHCATFVQMSLWRQVKVKLNEHKSVEGGFRYEEAIPPDTLMYFPWGITAQANSANDTAEDAREKFKALLRHSNTLQIGGQESLGRGFVQLWYL